MHVVNVNQARQYNHWKKWILNVGFGQRVIKQFSIHIQLFSTYNLYNTLVAEFCQSEPSREDKYLLASPLT